MGLLPDSVRCAETGPSKRLVGSEKSGSDGTAGFFDFFTGRGADFRAFDGELASELTGAENFDEVTVTADESDFAQSGVVDHSTVLEGIVEFAHIDDFKGVLELLVVEALLWQTAMHWHLTTFKAGADATTSAGHLTFVAFAGGFTVTGAFATADALAARLGTGAGFDVLELHEKLKRERGIQSECLALFDLLAASAEDFIGRTQSGKCGEGGAHDVGVVAGTQ